MSKLSDTGKHRLTVLANYLDALPETVFHLNWWFSGPAAREAAFEFAADAAVADMNECGATACAFGHACSIPEFKLAGLEADIGGPKFDGSWGYGAAGLFFELASNADDPWERGYDDAVHLFCPDAYPRADHTNPKAVAARIREYIAAH